MRGFCLGAIAMVAACGSDGIHVEVRVPPDLAVDQVELYLGTSACKPDVADFDCGGIVPPPLTANTARPRVPGEVYFVDDNRPFISVPDDDGSAWFELQATGLVEIQAAIAVGRDLARGESGVAILEIDLTRDQHIQIDLSPVASQIVTPTAPQPAVEIWHATDDAFRCVAAEVQNRAVYIVPEGDPDCDEVAPLGVIDECLPGVFLGSDPISVELAQQRCTLQDAQSQVCLLGDRACDETSPTPGDKACSSSAITYCVPDATCPACGDNLGGGCLATLFSSTGTHIDCKIQIEPTIDGGLARQTCPNPILPANLGACTSATIALLDDGLAGFQPTAELVDSNNQAALIPTLDNGCNLGFLPPNATFDQPPTEPVPALVKFDTSLGIRPRFAILPLTITYIDVGQCSGDGSTCKLIQDPGEHVGTCFQ